MKADQRLRNISEYFIQMVNHKYSPFLHNDETIIMERYFIGTGNENTVHVFAKGYYQWMKRKLGTELLPELFRK